MLALQWRTILIVGALATSPLVAARAQDLPDSVTAAMVEEGKGLFAGAGICSVCHGPDGQGVSGLGPNLADEEWLHSDGSFEAIVAQITKGVPAEESKGGLVMAPRGGSSLTNEQVRAVAAYVWSLRRG